MKKILLAFLLNLLLFSGAIAPALVEAETYTIKLQEPIPTFGAGSGAANVVRGDNGVEIFTNYVSRVYVYAAFVAGIFCVAVIIFQSINIIMGGANNSFVSEAKDKIMQAIFSLILLLGAAMILRLINPFFFT